MSGEINNYVSRYVVPFYFEYEDDGYARIVKQLRREEKAKTREDEGLPEDCKWVEKGWWEEDEGEMDIYAYLLDVLKEERQEVGTLDSESNLGTSFLLETSGSLFKLQYTSDKKEKGYIGFRCSKLGILIFRNGIGFAWYDIRFGKNNLTTDEYVEFQNDFKELARTHEKKIIKKVDKDKYEDFCMGKWLAEVLNAPKLGIRFWAERKSQINEHDAVSIPDKALLFQYLFINETEKKERMELAFRVANGYDQKYNSPSTLQAEIYEPFGNACFYTSKSGTAYVVSDDGTNTTFFKENFAGKYQKDYFFIYVLLLYQTYSSAHYSRLLTKLPAYIQALEKDLKYVEKLESLDDQINLFLVKSVYESVSNVQHQNGAYAYGKKALHIDEDMKSLTVGLTALRGIEEERQRKIDEAEKERQRKIDEAEKEAEIKQEQAEQKMQEERDRNLNIALVIFGFLSVFSAAIDAMDFVDWIVVRSSNIGVFHVICLVIIGVVALYLFFVLIVSFLRKSRSQI